VLENISTFVPCVFHNISTTTQTKCTLRIFGVSNNGDLLWGMTLMRWVLPPFDCDIYLKNKSLWTYFGEIFSTYFCQQGITLCKTSGRIIFNPYIFYNRGRSFRQKRIGSWDIQWMPGAIWILSRFIVGRHIIISSAGRGHGVGFRTFRTLYNIRNSCFCRKSNPDFSCVQSVTHSLHKLDHAGTFCLINAHKRLSLYYI
jgi:hypothetical protein